MVGTASSEKGIRMFISHKYRVIFIHIQRTGGNSIQKIFEEFDPDLIETIPIDPSKRRTKHCFLSDIRAAVSDDIFHSYTKFCVVRNPFDRMVSWYSMFKHGWGKDEAMIKTIGSSKPMNLYHQGLARFNRNNYLRHAYITLWKSFFRLFQRFEQNSTEEVAVRHITIGAQVMDEVNKNASNFEEFVMLPRDHPSGLFERFYINQVEYISDLGSIAADKVLRLETLSQDFDELARAIGFAGRLPHINSAPRKASYRDYYTPRTRELIAQRFQRDCEYFGYEF